jgi:hypothetical protein
MGLLLGLGLLGAAFGIDTVKLLSNKINHPTENMHWLFAFELFKTILQINI